MSISVGDEVKDEISGLVGIVTTRSEWLYGCVRVVVQPQEIKDGKPVESVAFDEDQLVVLTPRKFKGTGGKVPVRHTTGGDQTIAPRPKEERR